MDGGPLIWADQTVYVNDPNKAVGTANSFFSDVPTAVDCCALCYNTPNCFIFAYAAGSGVNCAAITIPVVTGNPETDVCPNGPYDYTQGIAGGFYGPGPCSGNVYYYS